MTIKRVPLSIALVGSLLVAIESAYPMEDDRGPLSNAGQKKSLRIHVLETSTKGERNGIPVSKKVISAQLQEAYRLYYQGNMLAAIRLMTKAGVVVKYNFGIFLLTKENFTLAKILFQEVADTQLTQEELKDRLTRKSVASAQFNLALMLENTKDKEGKFYKTEALKYYRLAAANGSWDAHCNAAVLLCEAKQFEEARQYLVAPAQKGVEAARDFLRFLDSTIIIPQRKKSEEIARQLLLSKRERSFYSKVSESLTSEIAPTPTDDPLKGPHESLSNQELIELLDGLDKMPRNKSE